MTPTRRILLCFAAIVVALVAVAVYKGETRDPLAGLEHVGAVELQPDSARATWWTNAAHCLKLTAPYDVKLRYFVGDDIPSSWDAVDEGGITIGYTDPRDHLILLAHGFDTDSTVIVHEQLHDYLGKGGHPAKYFGDSVAERCGYRPGHDE